MKEKTLSEKIYKQAPGSIRLPNSLAVEDVAEAVEKLKEELRKDNLFYNVKHFAEEKIDKIFGELK